MLCYGAVQKEMENTKLLNFLGLLQENNMYCVFQCVHTKKEMPLQKCFTVEFSISVCVVLFSKMLNMHTKKNNGNKL